MATQGASAKKHATKPKAEKPKAEKPKAEKPKAEKPKAEKPKAEPKEKTTPPAEKTPKTKQTTVWDILLLGKKNKHGKYVTYKSINQTIFEPATEEIRAGTTYKCSGLFVFSPETSVQVGRYNLQHVNCYGLFAERLPLYQLHFGICPPFGRNNRAGVLILRDSDLLPAF
jgi:hypothetical protein